MLPPLLLLTEITRDRDCYRKEERKGIVSTGETRVFSQSPEGGRLTSHETREMATLEPAFKVHVSVRKNRPYKRVGLIRV